MPRTKKFGETALFKAIERRASFGENKVCADIVRLLIENHATLDILDIDGKYSPLMKLARKKQPELVQLMIEKDADVDLSSKGGDTPLMHAAENGRTENIKLLIEGGADWGLKNKFGKTAMDLARTAEVRELLKSEIQKQTNPFQRFFNLLMRPF